MPQPVFTDSAVTVYGEYSRDPFERQAECGHSFKSAEKPLFDVIPVFKVFLSA